MLLYAGWKRRLEWEYRINQLSVPPRRRKRTTTTSRHKKNSPISPPPVPPTRGQELLRRALLGLATALIVARGLVPSEDAALLNPQSNPLGLAIPLLWLCGLVTWAAWRIWSSAPWYGTLVEGAFFLLVAFFFLATAVRASYKHPAWLISWEWLGIFAAFFLIRQIARNPSDQRGLLASLLATGIGLAGQSLVQRQWPAPPVPEMQIEASEWPRLRCELLGVGIVDPHAPFPAALNTGPLLVAVREEDTASFQRVPFRYNVFLEKDEAQLPSSFRPQPGLSPTATFQSGTTFAAFLALLLPTLVGCVIIGALRKAPRWQLGFAFAFTAIVALALWQTQVRSATVPCLLVGAAAAILTWRFSLAQSSAAPRRLLFLGLAGPTLLVLLAFVLFSRGGSGLAGLIEHWRISWEVISTEPWLGVGPGNFSRYVPRFLQPTSPDVSDAGSFVLQVWSDAGFFAVVMLVLALGVFFFRTLSILSPGYGPLREESSETDKEGVSPRWEFYEGGMAGLVLGFVMRSLPLPPEEIKTEAVIAGVRAVVWFGAFALIYGIRWSGATRVLACVAGVATLLIHAGLAGGLNVPGLSQPMWILAALALNGLPEQALSSGNSVVERIVMLGFTGLAALLCYFQSFQPMVESAGPNRAALAVGQRYLDARGGFRIPIYPGEKQPKAADVLRAIIQELQTAIDADPQNARLWVDLANWNGELFAEFPDTQVGIKARLEAGDAARTAQRLDPRGAAGFLAEARIQLLTVRQSRYITPRTGADPSDIAQSSDAALSLFSKLVEADPKNPRLLAQLAEADFTAGDEKQGRINAQGALSLDALTTAESRRLTDRQREHLRQRIANAERGRLLP
jgi:O-antigen ligase